MKTLSLSIEGMHCGACVNRVTRALEKVEGVRVGHVEVGKAQIELQDGSEGQVLEAVKKAGYEPRVA